MCRCFHALEKPLALKTLRVLGGKRPKLNSYCYSCAKLTNNIDFTSPPSFKQQLPPQPTPTSRQPYNCTLSSLLNAILPQNDAESPPKTDSMGKPPKQAFAGVQIARTHLPDVIGAMKLDFKNDPPPIPYPEPAIIVLKITRLLAFKSWSNSQPLLPNGGANMRKNTCLKVLGVFTWERGGISPKNKHNGNSPQRSVCHRFRDPTPTPSHSSTLSNVSKSQILLRPKRMRPDSRFRQKNT